MQFESLDVVDMWRDFTTQTRTEVSMSSLESVLARFASNKTGKSKETIDFPLPEDGASVKLTLTFYPDWYTKARGMEDVFNIALSYPDIVRTLFHVQGPFVVIRGSSDFRIKEASARRIVSFGVSSAVAIAFEYPVFVCIPLKPYLHYVGFQYKKGEVTHFASQSHYWDDNLVSTFPEMRAAFLKGFHAPKSVMFSGRQILTIDCADFSAAATYRHVSFYSKVNADPLYRLKLFFQWDCRDPEGFVPVPSNASELVIIPEFRAAASHHTGMRSFIKRLASMKEHDNFQEWVSPSAITESVKSEVEKVFGAGARDVRGKVVLKAAPAGSLVAELAVLIARHKTVKDFAEIWMVFVKKMRECAERKEAVANVSGEKVDFGCCLIYQKLQLFNMCIAMLGGKEKVFVQSEDQYEQSRKFYEQTKERRYLLECWKTREAQFGESREAFESEFAKIEGDVELDFDPALQIEMIVDYLECMKPTEVFEQIVLVQVEAAVADVESRALVDIPMSKEAVENVQKAMDDFRQGKCELASMCEALETNTLKIEIVNSALSKIPSAATVNEMLTKGFTVIRRSSTDGSVSPLVEALNLDSRFDDFIQRQDYVFTGESEFGEDNVQYMFVSKRNDNGMDMYVIATAIREPIRNSL